MKGNFRSLAWIIPSAVILFACTMTSAESTPAPDKTAAVEEKATAKPTEKPSNVIFEDDFSDSSSGWDTISDESGVSSYTDGHYLISVNETLMYLYEDLEDPSDLADIQIDVDLLKTSDVVHDAGVMCRIQDSDNFYYFVISSDGFYAIGAFKDGEDTLLGSEDMLEDTKGIIKTGVADNHMRADCIGNTLTLYVNGTELYSVEDSDFSSGSIGLIAGSYEDVPITVIYDNFVLTRP